MPPNCPRAKLFSITHAKFLLSCLILVLCQASLHAQNSFIDHNFIYIEVTGGVQLAGWVGGVGTIVTISSTVNGYNVVSVADGLFTTQNISSINVDPSNIALASVDGVLFNKDQTTLLQYPAGKGATYSIPEGTTSIQPYAFGSSYNSLTTVTISSSVSKIGKYAFYYCTGLTNVTIPRNVTDIEDRAFTQCQSLRNAVFLGDAPISFGVDVFYNAASDFRIYFNPEAEGFTTPTWNGYNVGFIYGDLLCSYDTSVSPQTITVDGYIGNPTSISIPETIGGYNVTAIADRAFEGCSSLTSVHLPNSITFIGKNAFSGSGIVSINVPSTIVTLGNAFAGCNNLTDIHLPDSVTTIGEGAFMGCTGLASIHMSQNITSIGKDAFKGCTSLAGIDIPKHVNTIGDQAFYGCANLTRAYFNGDEPTSFGSEVFDGCPSSFVIYYFLTSTGYNRAWPTWYGYKTTMIFITINIWITDNFSSDEIDNHPEISGLTATPAGDGIPNLMKYALGLDPKSTDTSKLPKVGMEEGEMTLHYTQVNSRDAITYTPEVSTDMIEWHSGASYISLVESIDYGATSSVTVKSLVSPSQNSKVFMRLKVSAQ